MILGERGGRQELGEVKEGETVRGLLYDRKINFQLKKKPSIRPGFLNA